MGKMIETRRVSYGFLGNPNRKAIEKVCNKMAKKGYTLVNRQDNKPLLGGILGNAHTELTFRKD